MKYYKVICYTAFCGEEGEFYIKTYNEHELRPQIDECVYENALEWYDEQTLEENDMTEEEYYAECGVKALVEISEEEYYEACPWDEKEKK